MFLKRTPRPIPAPQPTPKTAEPRNPRFAKPLRHFELILEWAPEAKRDPRIQRLGFKAEGGFPEAVTSAVEYTRLVNSMYSKNLSEKGKEFCRLLAVYEEKAFKDYAAEPLYKREAERKFLTQNIEIAKQGDLKTETPKRVRVR